ncbi:MAG: peptide deformylase [Ignavibacteriales bacterium]|nr:peptide deformylase [Ignavibacteriales bacterium]
MAILPIYLYGTDILKKKARAVDGVDSSIIKLMVDLAQTMRKANGIGLAATQVGDMRQMLVVDQTAIERAARDEEEEEDAPLPSEVKTLVMINPFVVDEEGTISLEEGCLSIPELRAEVNRAERIRVKFRDDNFDEKELTAEGFLGRVILHEIDHLNGILFVDRIGKTRKTFLNSELKRIKKGEVDTSYPVVTALEV